MTVTRGSKDRPCTKCGNELYDQVDGVCFECITAPLIEAEKQKASEGGVMDKSKSSGAVLNLIHRELERASASWRRQLYGDANWAAFDPLYQAQLAAVGLQGWAQGCPQMGTDRSPKPARIWDADKYNGLPLDHASRLDARIAAVKADMDRTAEERLKRNALLETFPKPGRNPR